MALMERYRAIVELAAGCGWRGGEIVGLERDAGDFEAQRCTYGIRSPWSPVGRLTSPHHDQDEPPDE
jgi:integrase